MFGLVAFCVANCSQVLICDVPTKNQKVDVRQARGHRRSLNHKQDQERRAHQHTEVGLILRLGASAASLSDLQWVKTS